MDEHDEVILENVLYKKVHKDLMDSFIDSDTAHYMNTLDGFRDPETNQYPGYDDIQNHPECQSSREEVIGFRQYEKFAIIFDNRTREHYCTLQYFVDEDKNHN